MSWGSGVTDFNDPNQLADALDMFAKGAEAMANYYRAEQFHQSDIDGALFRASKLRAAAVLLRRQGEALAALTDAIGDLDGAAIEATRLRHAAFHGASQRMFRIINAAAAVGSVDAAPTLVDTEERSDG